MIKEDLEMAKLKIELLQYKLKSTHWIHADLDMDSLPEAMGKTPEEAAQLHVKTDNPSDDGSDDRYYLTLDGYVEIKLQGLLETTELLTEKEQQFCEYEPGQTWYKKTGETKTVLVSLKFEVVE